LGRIDTAAKDVIQRTVYNFYKENRVPTLELIREKLRDFPEYNYTSLETLREILISCGFKYKKLDNRMVIMESRRIVELRREYLSKIKQYRNSNRNIIYLDETWFDTHDVVKYGWVDNTNKCALNTPCSRGKRVIILHAGSKDGFVSNALLLSAKNITKSSADYHEDMTADLFEKWFVEQLLPNIPPNSVIVMDNASYHSRILNKIPNNNTKKDEILKFMQLKNITVPKKIPVKKELIRMIKSRNFKNEYVIDTICSRHGHTLLRLPPYYCIFNPIEMVWGTVKKRLRKYNQSPTLSAMAIENIREIISGINSDVWKNCEAHVVKIENEYPVLPAIAPIVIQPGNDSTSEDSDDSFRSF
jgi:transposase